MNSQDQVKELEQLEVIESNELKVGNAFHSFRFRVTSDDDDVAQHETKKSEV
ncbi:hypothetical protein [Sorangium sp. So ce693]|uniref:hypothetical protein n=1 Tax=Sorangium sp. So ce693 TaxID=3133318 RepID=UPI003F641B5C